MLGKYGVSPLFPNNPDIVGIGIYRDNGLRRSDACNVANPGEIQSGGDWAQIRHLDPLRIDPYRGHSAWQRTRINHAQDHNSPKHPSGGVLGECGVWWMFIQSVQRTLRVRAT